MDKTLERSHAKKILRRLAKDLASLGFSKVSDTLHCHQRDYVLEFIAIHKFSFGPSFRICFGIRVINDNFPQPAINGPCSDSYQWKGQPTHGKYDMRYQAREQTIEPCVRHMFEFCKNIGVPWFSRWANEQDLLTSPESPLKPPQREVLALAIAGKANVEHIKVTKHLFKLAV